MIAFGSEDTIFLGSLSLYCSIHDVYELCWTPRCLDCAALMKMLVATSLLSDVPPQTLQADHAQPALRVFAFPCICSLHAHYTQNEHDITHQTCLHTQTTVFNSRLRRGCSIQHFRATSFWLSYSSLLSTSAATRLVHTVPPLCDCDQISPLTSLHLFPTPFLQHHFHRCRLDKSLLISQ